MIPFFRKTPRPRIKNIIPAGGIDWGRGRDWLQNSLRRCGIDVRQRWDWLSLFFIPPEHSWKEFLSRYFPHVDFDHLKPDDLIRIPLQLLWIVLIKPPSTEKRVPLKIRLQSSAAAMSQRFRRGTLRRPVGKIQGMMARVKTVFFPKVVKAQDKISAVASNAFWDHEGLRYMAYAVSIVLSILCITTPFSTFAQVVYLSLLLALAFYLRKKPGKIVTLLLILLSISNSTRYLWWRIFNTLNWDESVDLLWGILLLLAECYTMVILLFSYVQTAWPLKRLPYPLPKDTSLWPHVDVFIPTYNEDLSIVKSTVFSAQGMDWPQEKLHVYILDDGRREEFRAFAEEAGVNYIIRPDNRHAKAGNMNHALTKTSGEFIAVFDCDHIPARSFLQITMGWFLRDPKLAVMQTPHNFFSPDPFERNLGIFHRVPNEGELFYGLIQDGNDLWNATFFCGSCAVIRRGPLEEVGGVAVETVTEDAHTSLKIHRLGYTSAYLNIAQASGLATESLSGHIGQRIRWARGMAQIFRLDNPFLGKGLKWHQRICYSSAMMNYLVGIPKLIYLTAPLAFLIFHTYLIFASAITVALYVIPHMFHVNIANSRIQGKYRHSFWGEVYETVLAWYIAIPTTVALLQPGKGTFNVTAKGGLVGNNYFDWTISAPYLVLAFVNLTGFGFGIWRIFYGPGDEIPTVILNLFWTFYNIIILGGAVAVASEVRQIRRSHRVNLKIPAVLRLSSGKLYRCHTEDFSSGGVALELDVMPNIRQDEEASLIMWRGEDEFAFPAKVVSVAQAKIRLQWMLQDSKQEAALVQCTFGRADAWVPEGDTESHDHPIKGLNEVIALGFTGYLRLIEHTIPVVKPLTRGASRFRGRLAGLLPQTPLPLAVKS